MFKIIIKQTEKKTRKTWGVIGEKATTKEDRNGSYVGDKLSHLKAKYGYFNLESEDEVEIFNQSVEELDLQKVICAINNIESKGK